MIVLWNSSVMRVELTLVEGDNHYEYEWQADRTLARDMLAYLRDRLAEHEATFADITGIGVFRGPGSYTGLRIGMTVLNTIASTSNIPIVGSVAETWRQECEQRLSDGQDDKIVLPEYGGEAHTTKPRK